MDFLKTVFDFFSSSQMCPDVSHYVAKGPKRSERSNKVQIGPKTTNKKVIDSQKLKLTNMDFGVDPPFGKIPYFEFYFFCSLPLLLLLQLDPANK